MLCLPIQETLVAQEDMQLLFDASPEIALGPEERCNIEHNFP